MHRKVNQEEYSEEQKLHPWVEEGRCRGSGKEAAEVVYLLLRALSPFTAGGARVREQRHGHGFAR
jgi:hypothetical protein